jgi:hypothetical protein
MTLNRRLLNWGAFFVTTGALALAITAGLITADGLATLFGLWPVLVIALGVGVLLRATRLRTTGGLVLAIVPGLVLGGLLGGAATADLPDWREVRAACIDTRQPLGTREGTFAGGAAVDLDLAWGELDVRTAPGAGWTATMAGAADRAPDVEASATNLRIASAERTGWAGWRLDDCAADDWRVTLPMGTRLDLATEIAAGEGTIDLAGAQLGDVDLVVQAADLDADLSAATAEDISLRVEAGAADLVLPATGSPAVDIDVDAGAARICAPAGMALRVRASSSLASITTPGLVRVGDAWESPDYATATHRADVTVSVNVGSVDINPEGGCK